MYTTSNIHKGRILEDSINTAISSLGITLNKHFVNREGLDLKASISKVSIIGEAINWYGGYIHPLRFKSIIGNLAQKADIKLFVCAGVNPTKEQRSILKAMNVTVIHLPKQVLKESVGVINYLRSNILSTIYHTISSTLGKSISSIRSKIYRILKVQKRKSMEQRGIDYKEDFKEVGNYINKLLLYCVLTKQDLITK
jgi:hypothetical protein